jgi:phage tail-like protein
MSRLLHPGYRFATEAQWQACQFTGADRRTADTRKGLRPFSPYGLPPHDLWTGRAHAPAVTDVAELLWRDEEGRLQRLPYGDKVARAVPAPAAIGAAKRMIATPATLWVAAGGTVQAFDSDSLTRLFEVKLDGFTAIDIAGDGRDGIYVLAGVKQSRRIFHLDCAGQVDLSLELEEPADASALVFLGDISRLVLLGSNGSKLFWIDPEDGRLESIVLISTLRTCFDVIAIASDGCSRLFLAGTDGPARSGGHRIVLADADGNLLGAIPIAAPVTGMVANRSQLFVTTTKGVVQFDPAARVPQEAGEVGATVLTPLLRSPSQGPQQWLRIEAKVVLTPGCSIAISHASARDPKAMEQLLARLADTRVPQSQRLAEWRSEVSSRTFLYHGDPARTPGEPVVLSAPLHDVQDSFIWVEAALIAAPGGSLPVLSELTVLYPGPTLIEHLPAIYRSRELETGDFARGLVGVLEAGTQNLDAKIGELGRNIHPATAADAWLDAVAGWLGLPWDNALTTEQKRRIVSRGALIADGYGTRAGLEALLDSLMPERPRRFRIVDTTAEFGLATIAGGDCEGSRLPAILAGLPATATELGHKAIIGQARLPCGDPETDSARFIGRVRIDIAASAEERRDWSPWIGALVGAMLPATARAELRWLGPHGLSADRLGKDFTLGSEPAALLGTDAVTSAARLGGRRRTTLPGKLTQDWTLQ